MCKDESGSQFNHYLAAGGMSTEKALEISEHHIIRRKFANDFLPPHEI
jgi:hypothetical protein